MGRFSLTSAGPNETRRPRVTRWLPARDEILGAAVPDPCRGVLTDYRVCMVTHIVLFRFSTLDDAKEAVDKLLSMRGRVPSLLDIEAGVDFTRSERSFELGLITRHASAEALDEYRRDPVHQEVAAFVRERSTGAASVDFEAPAG